ncbi:MAG TPA: glycine zipper 2TM domain-containing protein [Gemmatimonadales bacterium]|nr:glycine zipper 2TM domain-containing protein [Gemmatimonadales bacterium]
MTSLKLHGALRAIPLLLFAACSAGESTERPAGSNGSSSSRPAAAPASYTLAAGTVIDAAMTDGISSRHGNAGDVFTARVVEDVKNAGGRVVIPAGSMVQGAIVEVSPAPNSRSTGTLTLAVSSVTVQGRTYDLEASIDSLETLHQGRGIEGVDAARVAGGAAAGAILGQVIGGNSKGTIIGGVVGGAAGAAVSVIMKDVDIVLPAGSHLILTLRKRLAIRTQ